MAAPITGSNEILQAGQYLVDQNIDMMLVAADNTVYLGLPVLAKLASEKQIPLLLPIPVRWKRVQQLVLALIMTNGAINPESRLLNC